MTLPNEGDFSVRVTVFDYFLTLDGVATFPFATAVVPAKDAIRYADTREQVEIRLKPVGENRRGLESARLFVHFEVPSLEDDMRAIQQKWEGGKVSVSQSGLLDDSLEKSFLRAAAELDNLVYFLDVLFSQCLELAQLLGDFGMVVCVKAVRGLLDEIEQRVIAVDKAISTDLNNDIYAYRAKKRDVKWGSLVFAAREADSLVAESLSKMRRLKGALLSDVASLR